MNSKQFRSLLRYMHLGVSAVLGTYIYSPWGDDPTFTLVVRVVVIPLAVLSGLVMWQQARVVRWLKRDSLEAVRPATR